MKTLQYNSHHKSKSPSKIEVSLTECCRKGYYLCHHCSRISHVGDYHEEDAACPPRCPHCKRIAVLEWHPPVLEDDMPAECKQTSSVAMAVAAMIVFLLVFICGCESVFAMDRFEALSQIESGDNDNAVGPGGEVSRYQIMPEVWREYTKLPLSAAVNPVTARTVAEEIMADRARGVVWDDFHWYMVWHRPARIFKPTTRETDRARRFANLVSVP